MIRNINKRSLQYNFSDLVDRLSIDQIKQFQIENSSANYEKSILKIMKSIDKDLSSKKIELNEKNVNILLALSQINLEIWFLRKQISQKNKSNSKKIKLSHQLNAIRNKLKNQIYDNIKKNKNKAVIKSNIDKEDLIGWDLSILNE